MRFKNKYDGQHFQLTHNVFKVQNLNTLMIMMVQYPLL